MRLGIQPRSAPCPSTGAPFVRPAPFFLATGSQQNGLKNARGAKHLRHVFNNVVYNVDFSSILFHRIFFRIPLPTFISF